MLIETWIAALFMFFCFAIGIMAILGWIVEGEKREKGQEWCSNLHAENILLTELNGQLESKVSFLELQVELLKNKQADDADTEESKSSTKSNADKASVNHD